LNALVREIASGDRSALIRILSQIESFHADDRAVALELIDVILYDPGQKDYSALVSQDETGKVNGYICFGPTPLTEGTYDIYWVAVDPASAGNGIGTQLLKSTEDYLRAHNGRLIIIETSSAPEYQLTCRFYEKNAYVVAERIRDFFRDGEDRLTYLKRLRE
jgi:ribosomal protein S18 acetylase RimI-like enzyme